MKEATGRPHPPSTCPLAMVLCCWGGPGLFLQSHLFSPFRLSLYSQPVLSWACPEPRSCRTQPLHVQAGVCILGHVLQQDSTNPLCWSLSSACSTIARAPAAYFFQVSGTLSVQTDLLAVKGASQSAGSFLFHSSFWDQVPSRFLFFPLVIWSSSLTSGMISTWHHSVAVSRRIHPHVDVFLMHFVGGGETQSPFYSPILILPSINLFLSVPQD